MDFVTNFDVKPELIWMDFESNGLHKDGPVWPLEVGFAITDMEGNIARTFQRCVLHDHIPVEDFRYVYSSEYVRKMHEESGLWNSLAAAAKSQLAGDHLPERIQERILAIFEKMNLPKGEIPLVGSTINFDRQILIDWFPKVNEFLHYRNIDISTLKELCRRLNAPVYEKRPKEGDADWVEKQHRSVSDIKDSINEYRFYKDNFLHEAYFVE